MIMLLAAVAALGGLAGCSAKGPSVENVMSAAVEEADTPGGTTVAYEQLLYMKYSERGPSDAMFAKSGQELDNGLLADYETYRKAVPGGFLVKEDRDAYFICVSVGRKRSVEEGFRIETVRLTESAADGRPMLTIRVKPAEDERTPDGADGDVFVTSLIRIPKNGLPDGTRIADISMVGA